MKYHPSKSFNFHHLKKKKIFEKEENYYKIFHYFYCFLSRRIILLLLHGRSNDTCPRNTRFRVRTRQRGRKEREKKRKESKVNANRPRYPNDGIYTGRLHGDDLQPNRLICLGYGIFFTNNARCSSSINRFETALSNERRKLIIISLPPLSPREIRLDEFMVWNNYYPSI